MNLSKVNLKINTNGNVKFPKQQKIMNNRKKIILTGIMSFLVLFSLKAQLRDLPDTGQTQDYTSTFGEDSDYLLNPPDFTDNGDGTITDNVTGLMWQQGEGGEMTWDSAVNYASDLTLATHTNWRLPTSHELLNLLNYQVNPAIDTNYFEFDEHDFWWGATESIDDSERVWVTNAGGGIGPHTKDESLSAGGDKDFRPRCVRGSIVASIFTNNSDGTVTDSRTELIWAQSDFSTMTWEEALALADTSTYASYDDWRIPNIKELRTISDDTESNPSVDATYFSFITSINYWSSTTESNNSTRAWDIDYSSGLVSYAEKTLERGTLLVRNSSPLSIKDYTYQNLNIYPNPSSNFIQISGLTKKVDYKLFNISGKEISQGIISNNEKIDIKNLKNGFYFLQINNEVSIKFTKE